MTNRQESSTSRDSDHHQRERDHDHHRRDRNSEGHHRRDHEHEERKEESTLLKAVIKSSDMPDDLQQAAVEVASEAMQSFKVERDAAAFIKKSFDKRFGPAWQCVVGKNFGSYVSHNRGSFCYFYIGKVAVLLFRG